MDEAGVSLAVKQKAPIPLDAELRCAPGEVLAIVGPSGSGKSTLLRTIAGLYRPAFAHVTVNGVPWLDTRSGIDVPPHRRRVGLVFQNYALFPHMSALGNVAVALGHLPRAERPTRAGELLRAVGLSGLEARKPAALSGGQQQRVAVARALARSPEVLLLDEPFSAVDRVTRESLYAELRDLITTISLPILLVTHDFDEAARVSNSMSLLDRGTILQSGPPREVLARPVSVRAAKLVDLKNVFQAQVLKHEGEWTWLDWNGRRIAAARADRFPAGGQVAWTVPGTNVLISRTELSTPDEFPNRLSAVIRSVVVLRESLAVTVAVDGQDAPTLSLTLPAHYVRRKGLQPGLALTVALMPDGIHVMGRATAF